MPGPYSQDLRDRVASAISGGSSARAAAKRFSISTAIRWAQRLSATPRLGPWEEIVVDRASGNRADAGRPQAGPDAGGNPR